MASSLSSLGFQIRAAQLEAARANHLEAAAASLGIAELSDQVRAAQLQKRAAQADPSTALTSVGPENLLGLWKDSYGNSVSVYSTDAYALRLTATLSRPPRADIHLQLRHAPEIGGWICGNATLDMEVSSAEQLFWVFPSGSTSIWIRVVPEDTDDAGSHKHPPAPAASTAAHPPRGGVALPTASGFAMPVPGGFGMPVPGSYGIPTPHGIAFPAISGFSLPAAGGHFGTGPAAGLGLTAGIATGMPPPPGSFGVPLPAGFGSFGFPVPGGFCIPVPAAGGFGVPAAGGFAAPNLNSPAMPQTMPQAMPQAMPQTISQAMPQTMPQAMPQAMLQGLPQAIQQAMLQVMPQQAPHAMPHAMLQQADGTASVPASGP